MRTLGLPFGEEGLTLQSVVQIAGWTDSGGAAKHLIQSGEVLLNGVPENRRGKRLRIGDRVAYQGDEVELAAE